MKKIDQIVLIYLCLVSNAFAQAPTVKASETYKVKVQTGIVYGQGLSHTSINSKDATELDLLLDTYVPENDVKNRPAMVLIHGGGFLGGSRATKSFKFMGNYFASRGWVVFSIDYRLGKHQGTVPEKWKKFADSRQDLNQKRKTQVMAIYPALRDAKAALRWVTANADTYHINTDYITVGGGSAGAFTAIGVGISKEDAFKTEISTEVDPTLKSTHLEQTFKVRNIVDYWGGMAPIELHQGVFGTEHMDKTAPPILIIHGTKDPTVEFSEAKKLKRVYTEAGVPYKLIALEGIGHGAWSAQVDGKNLSELTYDYLTEQQALHIE